MRGGRDRQKSDHWLESESVEVNCPGEFTSTFNDSSSEALTNRLANQMCHWLKQSS